MGWFVTLCCISSGVACVAAIGVIGYVIYKSLEDSHKQKPEKKSSGAPVTELITFDDLKSENAELRHRKFSSADKKDEVVKVKTDPKPPSRSCEATQTVCLTAQQNNNISEGTQTVETPHANSHQETQTLDSASNLLNVIGTQTDLPNNVLIDQNSQTTNSLSNVDVSLDSTSSLNISSLAENNLNDGAESVFSDGSSVTVSSISSGNGNYQAWDQMTEAEREICLCTVCGVRVTTITYPCRHPYFCGECAPTFFKFYNHRCPRCKKRIKSYDNIPGLL